jgi:salicylate hydroxylase
MTSTPIEIAVIGAGIGGLAAAIALRLAGFDVDVYEQASELTEVGGGINMGPNAARILYRLGLADTLDREAVRPISTHQRRWQDGRTLHLPDGPAQEARDAEWASAGDRSPEALRWLYGFDAGQLPEF